MTHRERASRRASGPWAEFLRRILLSASLAGAGGIDPGTAGDNAPAETAEAEAPAEPPPGEPERR